MLLQSWGKTVRVFPSVPKSWKDISFEKLRAEGGFVVSATMKTGVISKVEITSTLNKVLRLRNNFPKDFMWNRSVTVKGNDLIIRLKAGQKLTGAVN